MASGTLLAREATITCIIDDIIVTLINDHDHDDDDVDEPGGHLHSSAPWASGPPEA